MSLRIAILLAMVLSIALAGCGSGATADLPDLVPVTGTVTQKGKPLAGALVTFEPDNGGPASTGLTDDTGRFELQYNVDLKGAVPGVHKVRISKMEGEAGDELIPAKFNVKSEMLQKVEQPGPNDIKIEI